MNAANVSVYQGDDYAALVSVYNADGSDADLSGYTVEAQIRRKPADSSVLVESFNVAIQPPNTIALSLTHDQTLALAGSFVWDLQLTETATGMITTILAGKLQGTLEVTRDDAVQRKRAVTA